MEGWISLYRCLLDKAIWKHSTPEQKTILVTLLLMANHEEKEWEWCGMQFKAKPGQFITSIEKIQEKAGKGVTRQNVRTALKKFKKYEFLTDESTKTGRLITIVNWGTYQSKGKKCNHETNQRVTDTSPTPNQQLTPNNNYNNDNNYKNDNNYNKEHCAAIVDYLNQETDKDYRPSTKKTQDLIKARTNEGFILEDFKEVIARKAKQWKGTEMDKFLRPDTLFSSKFEGYLNEKDQENTSAEEDNYEKAKRLLARQKGEC